MISIKSTVNYDYDVIIAGAGPAGASAAARLAKQNFKVLLIDASTFPRDKVCGDFVGPVAIKELEDLGITDQLEYQLSNPITKAALFLDGEELIEHDIPDVASLPKHGKVIPRMVLDQWIFELAKNSGAEIIENCRLKNFENLEDQVIVECLHEKEKVIFTARLLIGADGSNSTVGRLLTGKKFSNDSRILAVRAYYENISGPANRADLYFAENSFPGYYWAFPTGSGNANVGVGMVMETLPKNETHLKDLLLNLIQKDKALSARIGDGEIVGKVLGWPLSTYDPSFKIVSNRIILTGDAAGLINSLNGEGIQYALLSGRWTAEVAAECLNKNTLTAKNLSVYEEVVKMNIGYELALSRLVIQFIRNRSLNPFWLKLLEIIVSRANIDDSYADTAGGVLAGMVPANHVLTRSFLSNTIIQSGVVLGMDGLKEFAKGPGNWLSTGADFVNFTLDRMQEMAANPQSYGKWSMNLAKDSLLLFNYAVGGK